MKFTTASKLALDITGNAVLSSLLILMALIIGILAQSSLLLVASSVMAFGRPILYVALLGAQQKAGDSVAMEAERRTASDRRSSNRNVALGTR